MFLYRSEAVSAPKKFPEVIAADRGLKLSTLVAWFTPFAETAATQLLLFGDGIILLDSSSSDCQEINLSGYNYKKSKHCVDSIINQHQNVDQIFTLSK